MQSVIAGALGRGRPAASVARAVGPAGRVESASALTLGVVGAELLLAEGLLVAAQGRFYELERLARAIVRATRSEARPAGSPAALIARAWPALGHDLFGELRGEFAIVLWEVQRSAGVIACDALGNRTIHYQARGGGLSFASEVRDVLAMLTARPAPDRAGVAHWLAGGGPPLGRTLYEGIRRLPGGGLLRVDAAGRVAEDRWWNPRFRASPSPPDEAAHELRRRLATAVSRRLAADSVPGVLLSGGLDSASVAAVAARLRPPLLSAPRAYSAVFPNHPSVDESDAIGLLRRELELEGQVLAATAGSLLESAEEFVETWALPPSSPNLFFWMPLLRRARADGVGLMLDGEGGDELFGPARYLVADLVRRADLIEAWRLTCRLPGAGARPPVRRVAAAFSQYGTRAALPAGLHEALRRLRHAHGPADPWMRPETAVALRDTDETWAWRRPDAPRWWAGLLHSLTGTDGPVQARDHIRQRSAQAGLEATHPLLDEDVVELVLAGDPRLSFDPHLSRPLLRAAAAGVLPDHVRLRPSKSYFDAVFYESLRQVDGGTVRVLLEDRDARIGAFVDLTRMREALIDRPSMPLRAWASHTWRAATLELWLRRSAG